MKYTFEMTHIYIIVDSGFFNEGEEDNGTFLCEEKSHWKHIISQSTVFHIHLKMWLEGILKLHKNGKATITRVNNHPT